MTMPTRATMTHWIMAHWKLIAAAAIVLTVFVVCYSDHREHAPAVSPETKKTLDSMVATAPLVEAVVKHFQQDDSTIATRIASRSPIIHRASAEAAREGKIADSLAALAQSRADSSRLWHEAYLARTKEADSLLSANRGLAQDTIALNKRLAVKDSIIFMERQRRIKLDSVVAGISRELADKDKGCKLVGPVPCPTRAQSLAAGVIGTLLLRR